jgi:hypothetical protein
MEKVKDLHPQPGNRVFRDQLVTQADLQTFKVDLLLSIKTLIQNNNSQPVKKWLKSYEVKKLLNISPGTLQTLRSNGTLPYTRIGGMIYYDVEDINRMLLDRKHNGNHERWPALKKDNSLKNYKYAK